MLYKIMLKDGYESQKSIIIYTETKTVSQKFDI